MINKRRTICSAPLSNVTITTSQATGEHACAKTASACHLFSCYYSLMLRSSMFSCISQDLKGHRELAAASRSYAESERAATAAPFLPLSQGWERGQGVRAFPAAAALPLLPLPAACVRCIFNSSRSFSSVYNLTQQSPMQVRSVYSHAKTSAPAARRPLLGHVCRLRLAILFAYACSLVCSADGFRCSTADI